MKQSFFDHTREILAMIWTLSIIYFLWYCIVHYGKEKEILTWILAYLAGVSSAVTGAYFSINTHRAPVPNDLNQGTTTASITADITTTPKDKEQDSPT